MTPNCRPAIKGILLSLPLFFAAGSASRAFSQQGVVNGETGGRFNNAAARQVNSRAARMSVNGKEKRHADTHANDAASGQWTLIGPRPLLFTDQRQHSGQVNALAVDPRNSGVVYLGADGGGGGNPGTPLGTYTLTLTGTSISGSTNLTHDLILTLTVN
jgi:hypothetical protein